MRTIFQQIEMHAFASPEKPAILLPDRVITYQMLVDGIASVQRALFSLPLDREKPVGIAIDSPARHLILILALMKSGFASASLRSDQIAEALKHGIADIFVDGRVALMPGLKTHFVDDAWFSRSGGDIPQDPLQPNRIARLVLTSGSTGHPKLIGSTLRVFHDWIRDSYLTRIGSQERVLCMLGMSSAPIFVFRVLSAGNTICFSPIDQAVRTINLFAISEVRGSVAQFRQILDIASAVGANVRLAQVAPGGAELTADMADELQRQFKCEIVNSYSSTEVCYMAIARGAIINMRRERGNCFTPFSEIEIIDDSGNLVARGEEGRLRIRSDAMAWPYSGSLVETDAVKGDGWFYNGDIGRIDPDGLLIVTGRVDEVINFGGAKFAPEVIEENLRRHPRLQDIATLRMSDGETWLATPAPDVPTAGEINAWIAQNFTGERGAIKIDCVIRVDRIPVAPNGKVLRGELRRLLQSSM